MSNAYLSTFYYFFYQTFQRHLWKVKPVPEGSQCFQSGYRWLQVRRGFVFILWGSLSLAQVDDVCLLIQAAQALFRNHSSKLLHSLMLLLINKFDEPPLPSLLNHSECGFSDFRWTRINSIFKPPTTTTLWNWLKNLPHDTMKICLNRSSLLLCVCPPRQLHLIN